MTDRQDYDQPPWDPQQGYGQQYPQGQPWQPQQYDPGAHQRRMGGQQYGPQGQPPQVQPPFPPQGQPWPQPGYQPPQGPPGWQQPGYGQQGYGQPPFTPPQPGYQPGPQRPRKSWPARHKVLTGLIAFGCVIVIGVAANAAGSSSSSSSAASTAAQAPAPSSTAASAAPSSAAPTTAPAAQTVATYSGSGIENTPRFTVTDTWKLAYSFDCSNFGSQGNFQVFEDSGFNVLTNDLATSKSASTMQYNDAGTHYLEINSECSWTVKVIDEGS
jgi:hypothetical protein